MDEQQQYSNFRSIPFIHKQLEEEIPFLDLCIERRVMAVHKSQPQPLSRENWIKYDGNCIPFNNDVCKWCECEALHENASPSLPLVQCQYRAKAVLFPASIDVCSARLLFSLLQKKKRKRKTSWFLILADKSSQRVPNRCSAHTHP